MQTLCACAAIHHPTLIAQCPSPDPACGPRTSSISRCARSPIRSPIARRPRRAGDGAVKALAPALGVLSARALAACDAPKQASRGDAAAAGAGRGNSLRPARARAGPAGRRQGAHRERSRFSRRGQDGAAPRRCRRVRSRRATRSPASTKPISRLQLEQAEAERSSAHAALDQAEAEERRITTLTRQGWAANADFDKISRPPIRRAAPW